MTQIVLAINEQDCTPDDGNTAEEFEGHCCHASSCRRGRPESGRGQAGVLWARRQSTGVGPFTYLRPDCDDDALADPPAIARFDSMSEPNQSLRALALSMIEQYSRLSTQ